jgi:hypothetical protein
MSFWIILEHLTLYIALLFFPLFAAGKLWEKKKRQDWVLRFTQFRLQFIITVLYFFFLYFGCPVIAVVLVIVGRDMGRGAVEDA